MPGNDPVRITIIGGGSTQWVPKLVLDLARTKSLRRTDLVLQDIDPMRLDRVHAFVERAVSLLDLPWGLRKTTDQSAALEGADFVVVNISTGGFASMTHDLAIPARYGIHQSVGDTVGPGGVMRGLRNIPVFLGIAADMEQQCPDAWLLNLTNPLTTLTRAVRRESQIKAVGLCHEVTICSYYLSQLLGVPFTGIALTVSGVNHLPVITALDAGGADGLALLRDVLDHEPGAQTEQTEQTEEGRKQWARANLIAMNQVKLALFRLTGALPGAGDRHLVEFFPGFLTEESGQGRRWGVALTTITERERWEARYVAELEALMVAATLPTTPSGEMVHGVIDSILRDRRRELPLNIPNSGQCPDLPADVVVESICVVDGSGVRGRDAARVPPLLVEQLRRVSASQELVVEAAVTGDRDTAFAAMAADPLASRLDWDRLGEMTDEMITAAKQWLPQFA